MTTKGCMAFQKAEMEEAMFHLKGKWWRNECRRTQGEFKELEKYRLSSGGSVPPLTTSKSTQIWLLCLLNSFIENWT